MKLYLSLLTILLINCYRDAAGRRLSLNVTDAVSKAVKYLLKRTEPDEEWKNLMPRTVVAVALAVSSGIVPEDLLLSLKRELNIQIFMHLSQNYLKLSSFELAQYINALSATCQDPRIHGMNLVERLRSNVDFSPDKSSEGISPFQVLSLCIAGAIRTTDFDKLSKMFDRIENDRLSLKALTAMALACSSVEKAQNNQHVIQFVPDVLSKFNTSDIYTKSLSAQALLALHALDEKVKDVILSNLLQNQLSDGSFGDALSTYYAIPVLLNKSLLNLRCEESNVIEPSVTHRMWKDLTDAIGEVTYSLWIDQGAQNMVYTVKIGFNQNETFYDVMRKAEEKNEAFRFLYDLTSIGKQIYSVAGIPNDAESRKAWKLYRGFKDNVVVNSKKNLKEQPAGVDKIRPRDHDHFVFWFENGSN